MSDAAKCPNCGADLRDDELLISSEEEPEAQAAEAARVAARASRREAYLLELQGTLTEARLCELEQLLKKASARPWTADDGGQADWAIFAEEDLIGTGAVAKDPRFVADLAWAGADGDDLPRWPEANAKLIAAAVNALPALVREVRALRRRSGAA